MTIFLSIVFLVHLISWVLYQKHQFNEIQNLQEQNQDLKSRLDKAGL
jgi:Tfp pilus assembly protein PilO